MAFNANTYRMNRHRRDAYAHLAKARDIKARVALGHAYDWEVPGIASQVLQARISMRLFRSARAICRIDAEQRRLRRL